jgi:hypothetical protein
MNQHHLSKCITMRKKAAPISKQEPNESDKKVSLYHPIMQKIVAQQKVCQNILSRNTYGEEEQGDQSPSLILPSEHCQSMG